MAADGWINEEVRLLRETTKGEYARTVFVSMRLPQALQCCSAAQIMANL
tara:strand:+ start:2087 stop:2233 length:147 start_codon:yes stop_codon:yes gene_type:complete